MSADLWQQATAFSFAADKERKGGTRVVACKRAFFPEESLLHKGEVVVGHSDATHHLLEDNPDTDLEQRQIDASGLQVHLPQWLQHSEDQAFAFGAAVMFTVLSKCGGDDAVVVVDSCPPVAVLNPCALAPLRDELFPDLICDVTVKRNSDEALDAGRTTLASRLSAERSVGFCAIVLERTVERVGLDVFAQAFDFVLVLEFKGSHSGLMNIDLYYNGAVYHQTSASWWLQMIQSIVGTPNLNTKTVNELSVFDHSMKQLLLRDWQPEMIDGSEYNRTAHKLFAHSMKKHCSDPKTAVCVVEPGRMTMTYDQVDVLSNKIASYLQNNVCKDQLDRFGEDAACALHMPRCAEWYCWMLGILKAGGAYLSLDPDFPANRLSYILEDSGCVCLITVSKLAGTLDYNGPVICIDKVMEEVEAIDLKAKPYKDLATPTSPVYMIYTSGSTGKPKGVLVEHRNLCNFVISERRMFQLGNHHNVIQGFSTSFDASLEEIWLAFASGSALVCVAKSIMQDAEQLQELITETKATVLSTVPTLLATMEASKLKALELVIVGGEACNKEVIEAYATGGKRMFVNSYGPTEATVACCAAFCKAGESVTIGRAQPGYAAYIVDEAMRLTPPGVPGELCMAGPSVTRGYVNRPELTREKFIHCPFHEHYDRMYRTGDLCRWNVNGHIEFLGRIDSQVKLRGFRIEIGEIETNLATFSGVTTAVVILRNDAGGMPYLCAYLICEPQLERDFSENKFRQHLATLLPTYMIPSRFVAIKVIPRSPAGKLDRNGFPPPEPPKEEEKKESDESAKKPPSTDTEKLLHEIWCKHLPNITIGVLDNFFEIGGHSLMAGKVASDIRKSGFEGFSIRYLYSHPTIEALATATESMRNLTKAEPVCTQLPFRKEPSFLRRCAFMLVHLIMMHFVFCLSSAYVLLYLYVSQQFAIQLSSIAVIPRRLAESTALCLALVVIGLFYSFIFVPIMKWTILGKVHPGMHSIWSWFFIRWWTVRAFANMVPLYGYSGTAWANLYLRLMGMKVGRGSVYFPGGAFDFDLISLGEDVCIGHESVLSASEVIDSVLVLRPITIGNTSTVGVRCCVKGGSIIGSECRLNHLSLLKENNAMKDGEIWEGSPAQVVGKTKPLSAYQQPNVTELNSSRQRTTKTSLLNDEQTTLITVETTEAKAVRLSAVAEILLMVGQLLIGTLLSFITTFPVFSMMLSIWQYMNNLRGADMAIFLAECFAAAPFAVGIMFIYLHIVLVILRWIVLPWKVKPGNYPVTSAMYHRKIMFDLIMRVSLGAAHPLYASIYIQYLLKLLGAEVGNRVECSNLYGFTPGLTKFGNETFVADFVGVNPPEVFRGVMVLGRVEIKDRAFVGNGAVLSQGRTLNERSLLGLLSHTNKDLEEGSTYIGSPAFHIPRQAQNQGNSSADSATYNAPCHLFIARCIWEYFRTVTPATLLIYSLVCSIAIISATIADIYDVVSFAKFMSLFVWLATIPPLLLILAIKWIIVGREKPAQYPLWSSGVWRAEFVVDCTTVIGGITFLPLWRGTPLMPLFFRALGAKIGTGCYIDTIFFTEPDMVTLGDHCCIGDRVTLQTHLFEDRVMKLDYLVLDDRVTVGPLSIVLYSTTVGRGCSIGSLSLVMKGESYPPGTHWEGVPAQRRTVPAVMAVAAGSTRVPHTASRPVTRDARPSSIKPQAKVDTATLKEWLMDDGLQTYEDAYY